MDVTEDNRNSLLTSLGEPLEFTTDGDSLFTQAQVDTWLRISRNPEQAALFGWRAKMAHYANLVTVGDGAAVRQFSDLFDHARQMVNMYNRLSVGPSAGRSRVGRIVRR